ncbi:MAG: DUF1588 domain-containing protein [Planctomycetota bacterium]|nr:DUF1588 domain-containing protein [Planctomycetota bacterium]
MIRHIAVWSTCLFLCVAPQAKADQYIPGQPLKRDFAKFAQPFLQTHCVDCHGGEEPAGNLSLQNLGQVEIVNADIWKSIWAQVALKEMPPKDAAQPEVIARLQFTDWVVGELQRALQAKGGFTEHQDPNKANFVDHALLFSELPKGIKLLPASSPTRIWRVTREEHITRLNELINKEPEYDASKPGLRTQGDVVPTNHGGELKMYFGTDRIIQWQGGTVAYATAVKSVPAILSSARKHGLENYPAFYTVNSAEATQIISVANDVLRYMADGPLSIARPYQITDDPNSIKDKMVGDLRGLPTSLVYSTKTMRPLTPVFNLLEVQEPTEADQRKAVDFMFEALTFRIPKRSESDVYLQLVQESIEKLGNKDGTILGLSAIFLDRDALFRPELAETGEADKYGRVMLQDWELGLAVNHAFSYIKPDAMLREAIVNGRMRNREDVRREVERILSDETIRKPRILQFFRDYFDYDLGGYICKDSSALTKAGVAGGNAHYRAMFDSTASTERLIEIILAKDQQVLRELLTTDLAVATKADSVYLGKLNSPKERQASIEAEKKYQQELAAKLAAELEAWKKANPGKEPPKPKKQPNRNINHNVTQVTIAGGKEYARVSRRSFGAGSMKPERTLTTTTDGQRLGLLTHPSWLVSHSDAMDNHAILRGRWIQERLIGGGIPDVPITVDAMLPDEPQNTLRERMRVTRENYCWNCHRKMDPLGLPFEMFNHAGLYREFELGEVVDTSGEIVDSGDPSLDGKVANAIELIEKLANSERAEQVFVRHAFRFWMGRNETLHDAPVLQEAYQAYKANGGSMNALLASLLTSDAFLYRRR